ncbi:MAG TPA: Ldh family oxidoreductase [Thermoanaerobaculia bacterium]|nr:Ldh family oxidoreductase [Thermoanaerobaculia bacterium]
MTVRTAGAVVPAERLKSFVVACLEAAGVTPEDAATVAEVLVSADLRGVSSHGVARLRRYVEGTHRGKINPRPVLSVVRENAVTALVDADNGLGQPAGVFAMRMAMDKAETHGVGIVGVRRTNHFGIAGYYALLALERGLIGAVTSNASPQVAPTFAAQPMYGTNPIAVALPTSEDGGFVLDMATSVVPRGKLERMSREGLSIPEGWAVDGQGRAVTDLDPLIAGLKSRSGLSLLPLGGAGERFGGHKGFGLGLLVDLLCGPLTGSSWGLHVYGERAADLGQWFFALRVDGFRDPAEFRADATALLNEVRNAQRMPGEPRIYIAGEKEAEESERRRQGGIPLLPKVIRDLAEVGLLVGVPFELTEEGGEA